MGGPVTPYAGLAAVYDALSSEYDYGAWVHCALTLYGRLAPGKRGPARVLDLCCGTGRASEVLARGGRHVTGVDASPDMLTLASYRLSGIEPSVLLICQDMRHLDLGKSRFDLVVSLCDSLNYLTSPSDLAKTLSHVASYLDPGGVLVFDLNTARKLATVYGDNTYVEEDRDFFLTWENEWDPRRRLCHMTLNLFRKAGGFATGSQGRYWERTTELHTQRAHSHTEVLHALGECGFAEVLGPLAAFSLESAEQETDRVFYAARRG